ncbi:cation transport regulator-like protein [Pseudomassariella vexata]|uniref:glutathione-specific gamma-glutamylcyclotransferase n=1 Tax=Pseudomassariella vexata TaxID=1141098 RepID=A0A1Y2E3J5_9PEZI|nr:cation transport regulator-like protein [Pseudomassariella vexata]ORY66017.1 cation transport regulator-like protein [Pseudomassariella vexata]
MAVNGQQTTSNSACSDDEFWLFGYGSLIWKPPPHVDRRIPGWVTGYVRRFWQASQDHRGTPEAPGRVVTLIERSFWSSLVDSHASAPDKVWGVAYRIKASKVAEVKDYLDIREINGYTIHYTPFQPADGSVPIQTLVYIGTPDNEQFTGPQEPQALAEHIARSEGPSGLNRDYLLGLEKALNELSPESGDAHVTDLSDRVRAIEAAARGSKGTEDGGPKVSRVAESSPGSHDFHMATIVDTQEETEKV